MPIVKLAGRYRLESEIARGGMAVVWLAFDEVLDRPVAAKILHDHLTADEVFRERFRIEALAAAKLTHPNIVSVFDTGEHEGTPFIVMEYLAGGTLRDEVERDQIGYERTAYIGVQVCEALTYAHASGIVHRDIKPANILFSENGHVKVADFGIAKAVSYDSQLTQTGAILGTVRYLSPEQVEGAEPDGRSDIYSLGIVLYECATGRAPFIGDTDLATATARLGTTPRRPRDIRPDVPRELDSAIMRSLDVSREGRFQDASGLSRALSPVAGQRIDPDLDEPTQAMQPGPVSFVKSEGRWLLPTVLLVLLAAALVYGVLQITGGRDLSGAISELFNSDEAPPTPLTIVGGGSYDPEGDDKQENEKEVRLAFDSDPKTFWKTGYYSSEGLGQLKDGVGIYVDLGKVSKVKSVKVTSITGGWRGSIQTSEDGRDWSGSGSDQETDLVHDFSVEEETRYVLVWITRLVKTQGQGTTDVPFSVGIAEIQVYG